MKGAGALLLLLGAGYVLSQRRPESSAGGSPGAGPGAGGPLPGPTPPAGGWPLARRTGYDGRDAWARYAREVEGLVRAELAAERASDVEQIVGAHAVAALALSENSGRAEYEYNAGNLRPVGEQPRARWPNGVLYRSFGSRAEGVKTLLRVLRNARYGPAWREAIAIANEGAAIEPLVGAWFASVHDLGYTDGPPASDVAARSRWLEQKGRTGIQVADLVTRALSSREAPSIAPSEAQDRARVDAMMREYEEGVARLRAASERDGRALEALRREIE